jgi:hypothetical protein
MMTPKSASAQTIPSIANPPPPRNVPKANGVYVPAINKKIAE